MIGKRRLIWITSMWTQQFEVYLCLSHFKLQFILDEIIRRFFDPSRNNLRSLWNNYSRQLRSWSKSRRRSQDCLRLIGNNLCGENHLFCVIELFELWIPKPTSFPTRCFAWEASVQNQSTHGKTELNGIWRHAIWKNWIELTENRWNSSGKNSRDSPHWEFSLKDDGRI